MYRRHLALAPWAGLLGCGLPASWAVRAASPRFGHRSRPHAGLASCHLRLGRALCTYEPSRLAGRGPRSPWAVWAMVFFSFSKELVKISEYKF